MKIKPKQNLFRIFDLKIYGNINGYSAQNLL